MLLSIALKPMYIIYLLSTIFWGKTAIKCTFVDITLLLIDFTDCLSGGSGWYSNLVDNRSKHRLQSNGGRFWDCPEGLLQEASQPAQHFDQPSSWRSLEGWQTKDHDSLYNWRPRSRCCSKDDSTKSGQCSGLHLAKSAETQVGTNVIYVMVNQCQRLWSRMRGGMLFMPNLLPMFLSVWYLTFPSNELTSF